MNDIPFEVLDRGAFDRLRGLLTRHRFTADGVCDHADVSSMYDYRPRRGDDEGRSPAEGPLDLLVRLFMDSEVMEEGDLEHLDGEERALLERFGLLRPERGAPGRWSASVRLYPTPGPWIVSDLGARPDDQGGLRPDAVYPALTTSARTFLETLPVGPAGDYLELCSGTGIAALMGAAGGAERAWAVDITGRATVFADFNARLNGLDNVTALEGDLWAPVEGRTFDIVVAHPPYVPAARPELIYRDGGEDGEQVTRAILEGLPAHLASGGLFQCTCALSARGGRPAFQRVRDALGDASREFDLVFVRNDRFDLTHHFRGSLLSADPEVSMRTAALLRRFDELELETVHFCTIAMRRHGEDRVGFTLDVERGAATRWPHLAWALAVGGAAADDDRFADAVLDAPVALAPGARFELSYRLGRDGEEAWVPTSGRIRVDRPFPSSVDVGMADAAVLAGFDGASTLRQHLHALQADGRLPPAIDPRAFARSFGPMVLAGIVDSGVAPLPRDDEG